jgi:uncharacterized protein DUF5336
MTYSSGGPGYPGAQQSGGYAPTSRQAKVDEGPSKLPGYLLGGVPILGLAAYLLSFGPVWKSGHSGATTLAIIAVLFASLFAIVALLPKQRNYTAQVTVTAAVGFLLAIWALIKGADTAGWALIVIVVLSALQTVVAIAVLLLDAGVISPPAPRPKYDPYQPYPGGYYGQPQFAGPPAGPPGPPAPGPHGPPIPGPQGFGHPQGPPQYGGYPGAGPTGGFPPQGQQGPPTPPTGFPTYAPPPSAPTAVVPAAVVPAAGEPQPSPPAQEAATEQVPAPQPSPSPSSPPPS